MKRHFKTFSIISLLLISFLFLKPFNVKAYNNTNVYFTYDYTQFKNYLLYHDTDNKIEEVKVLCNSIFDEYMITTGNNHNQNSSGIVYYCYDISNFSEMYYYNTTTANSRRYLSGVGTSGLNYAVINRDSSNNLTLSKVYSDSLQLLYKTSVPDVSNINLWTSGSSALIKVPLYSSKKLYYKDYNSNTAHFYIDNVEVKDGDLINFYYKTDEYITITDKCSTTGECLSHKLQINATIPEDSHTYGLKYYTEDGRLNDSFVFPVGGGYENDIDLELYHDTLLNVEFQRLYCPSADNCSFKTIQKLVYNVDVLYSEPTIKYTLSETEEKNHLAISYFLPLDVERGDYFYQYRVDNGNWILCTNNSIQFLEFGLNETHYIEARVLDGYQKVVSSNSFNINTSLLPIIRFEMYEDEQEYQNLKVYVSNVLSDGYFYTRISNSMTNGPYKLEKNAEESLLFESRYGNSSDLYVNIYDSNNNVVGTFSIDINVKRVPTVYDLNSSDSIFSYLTNYFDGLSSDFKLFGDGLQKIVDKYSGTSVEQILVIILILVCLVTTIKLGGS